MKWSNLATFNIGLIFSDLVFNYNGPITIQFVCLVINTIIYGLCVTVELQKEKALIDTLENIESFSTDIQSRYNATETLISTGHKK